MHSHRSGSSVRSDESKTTIPREEPLWPVIREYTGRRSIAVCMASFLVMGHTYIPVCWRERYSISIVTDRCLPYLSTYRCLRNGLADLPSLASNMSRSRYSYDCRHWYICKIHYSFVCEPIEFVFCPSADENHRGPLELEQIARIGLPLVARHRAPLGCNPGPHKAAKLSHHRKGFKEEDCPSGS